MPDFHWHDTRTRPLRERFPDNSIGLKPWQLLTDSLGGVYPLLIADCQRAFDDFMKATAAIARPNECRVFVSHRQADVTIAERIAYLANQAGYGYWLDVEDLQHVNKRPIPSPQKDFLVAAAIEMGLLNASHVIAALTGNSAGSKWIPYEFGRAKQRQVVSDYAAIWRDSSVSVSDCGEYVLLGKDATKFGITAWLNAASSKNCRKPSTSTWTKPVPPDPPLS